VLERTAPVLSLLRVDTAGRGAGDVRKPNKLVPHGRVVAHQAITADFRDFWWSIIIIILGEASGTAKLRPGRVTQREPAIFISIFIDL
jgi:hypothetical protein